MSDVVVWSAGMVIPITAPSILDGAVAVRDGRIEAQGTHDELMAGCPLYAGMYRAHIDAKDAA